MFLTPTYLIIHDSTQTHNAKVNVISLGGQSGTHGFSAMGQVTYSNVERQRIDKKLALNIPNKNNIETFLCLS